MPDRSHDHTSGNPGEHVTLHVYPDDVTLTVIRGETVLDALNNAGILLNIPCGGQGICGKCRVQFTRPLFPPTAADREHISEEELAQGFRLACRSTCESDATIHLPPEARVDDPSILLDGAGSGTVSDRSIQFLEINLESATLQNQANDLDRVRAALGDPALEPDIHFLRNLPGALRDGQRDVQVTLGNGRLLDIGSAGVIVSRRTGPLGVAVDLGTTTAAASLHDLGTGKCLGRIGMLNPQSSRGADVVSRISWASRSVENIHELQGHALECINTLIVSLCNEHGGRPEDVLSVTLAGNTTMLHLFLGVSPEMLAVAPYVPVFSDAIEMNAQKAGLRIHPAAGLFVFPSVGGFVGGDTVADVIASDMDQASDLTLLVDIGTNGEIVLGNRDRLLATSAAAGPAFEGRNISCGMRAEAGAIDRVTFGAGIHIRTIGQKPPTGLCGTGLVSLGASLLKSGRLGVSGMLCDPDDSESRDPVAARVQKTTDGNRYLIAGENEGASRDIFLTQKDIRELQLAKGAIRAAVEILLAEYGTKIDQVGDIRLAGAFGNFFSPGDIMDIGLLPLADADKIRFIGNAALDGAVLALLRADQRTRARNAARRMCFLELAGRPDFQDIFAESMLFA